jgi:hypothetical protein
MILSLWKADVRMVGTRTSAAQLLRMDVNREL